MRSVRSRTKMRWDSVASSGPSKRQSSTPSACSLNSEKLTPSPSHVAPCGYGEPGQTRRSGGMPLPPHHADAALRPDLAPRTSPLPIRAVQHQLPSVLAGWDGRGSAVEPQRDDRLARAGSAMEGDRPALVVHGDAEIVLGRVPQRGD